MPSTTYPSVSPKYCTGPSALERAEYCLRIWLTLVITILCDIPSDVVSVEDEALTIVEDVIIKLTAVYVEVAHELHHVVLRVNVQGSHITGWVVETLLHENYIKRQYSTVNALMNRAEHGHIEEVGVAVSKLHMLE
jgi:hypothetical protein